VKRLLKIVLLFSAVVLYCCNSGLYRNSEAASEKVISPSSGQHHQSSVIAGDFGFRVTPVENLVSGFNPLSWSSKNKLPHFQICRKVTESLIFNRIASYQFYSANLTEWFCKTDIIFPFHYFW